MELLNALGTLGGFQLVLLVAALLIAFGFECINGFHDTANAIATSVATKALRPQHAILMAAAFNFVGAFAGTAVAKTIGKSLVDEASTTQTIVAAALIGAIVWNLVTWRWGIPSSSSHALIGGLCGAAMATAAGNWGVLIWSATDKKGAAVGLWPKVVLPMFTSPLVGFVGGAILMGVLLIILRRATPRLVALIFGKAQLISAGFMGFSHGSNDAQKTMGIITLALFTGTSTGAFANLPEWAHFLRVQEFKDIPFWVVITCAITMAAGKIGRAHV